MSWREHETLVYDPRLLGEDEMGDLWMPSRTIPNWWDRRFCWWKPTHWPAYVRSRRRREVTMIESGWGW